MRSLRFINISAVIILLLLLAAVWAMAVRPPRLIALSDAEKRHHLANLYDEYARQFPSVSGISPEKLRSLQTSGEVIVVDGRAPEEQAVSMLPGAIPFSQFSPESRPTTQIPVVFYCTAGYRSAELAKIYAEKGYITYNLCAGILAWIHKDFPLVDNGEETNAVHVYGPQWNLAPDRFRTVW